MSTIMLVECVDCMEKGLSQSPLKSKCEKCFDKYFRKHQKTMRQIRQNRLEEARVGML